MLPAVKIWIVLPCSCGLTVYTALLWYLCFCFVLFFLPKEKRQLSPEFKKPYSTSQVHVFTITHHCPFLQAGVGPSLFRILPIRFFPHCLRAGAWKWSRDWGARTKLFYSLPYWRSSFRESSLQSWLFFDFWAIETSLSGWRGLY